MQRTALHDCRRNKALVLAAAAGMLLTSSGAARAQAAVEEFYRGKTINLIFGFAPAGGNEVTVRIVARHLSRHIPGAPTVVMRHMPGAGSLTAANHLYSAAAKDGTVIGFVSPTSPLDAKLGNPGARYQPDKFHWLSRVGTLVVPLMVWHTQPFGSWKDALVNEITVSATGAGSPTAVYPTVLNNVMKTRLKIVMGYKGSAEAMLAMERGETAGHSSGFDAIKSQHPSWISEGKVRFLLQFALTRYPAMQNVPTALEIAENDQQRAILRAVLNATEVGKSFLAPPGTPADRVDALRRAFDRMLASTEFNDEMQKVGIDVIPLSGERLQTLVEEVTAIPPAIVEQVAAAYGR
jgi:tripartite-type tricarboxylate transporter receptor subunit TctC